MDRSGILILDKPAGKSSAFISRLIGKKVGAKKVGHLGTLDPFATGVLPIALGEATKLINYINPKQKTYVFEMVFGIKTDTADCTGQVIENSQNIPSSEEVIKAVSKFIGEMEQVPPSYSAIKINGRKAYEIARKGGIPEIKPRQITIFSMNYIRQTSEQSHELQVTVSPGTYIRTLVEDLATSLKTVAYVSELMRIQDGIFTLDNAITLDALEENNYNVSQVLCELEDVLDDIPVIFIEAQKDIEDLRKGKSIPMLGQPDGVMAVTARDGFFAMVEIKTAVAYPKRIVRNCY